MAEQNGITQQTPDQAAPDLSGIQLDMSKSTPVAAQPAPKEGWFHANVTGPIADVAKRFKDAVLEGEGPGFLPYDINQYFNPTPPPAAATDEEAAARLKARNAAVNPTEIQRERDTIDKMRADSHIEQRNAKIYANGGEAKLISPEKFLNADERKQYPYAYGILRAVGGLTTQDNAEIMIGSQGLGFFGEAAASSPALGALGNAVAKLPRVVSAYFAGSMAKGLVQSIPGLVDAKRQYDAAVSAGDQTKADQILQEAKENAAEFGTNAYFTYAAAHHASTGHPDPIAKTVSDAVKDTTQYAAEKGVEALRNVPDAARATVAGAKSAAGWTADKLGPAIGRTNDFQTAIARAAKITPKQSVAMKQKIGDAAEDLQAIANANPDIEGPKEFADKIRTQNQSNEATLQAEAGATKDSTEPVVPNAEGRIRTRLDKYFDGVKGLFAAEDVEKAKQSVLDHFLQRDDAGTDASGNPQYTTRVPNLYEAENVRQGLNRITKPQFATNAQPTTDAFKAAALEAANETRSMIDEAYEKRNVGNVKETRSKEAKLIDIADALEAAQDKADKMGEGTVFRSLMKKIGVPSTVIAIALGHPVSGAAIGAAVLGDQISQNLTNPNVNVQRALDIAAKNPNAKATGLTDLTPAAGAPPAPATPPVNHKLYAALSSHYGKLIGSVPFDELEERFATDIQKATEQGKVTPEQKQLLQKMNEAKSDQRVQAEEQQKAEQQKAADKAAKDAEKQAAEQQKIADEKQKLLDERKEKEEKEQQKTADNVVKELADKEKEDLKAKENPEKEPKPKPAGRQSLIGKLTRVVHGPEDAFADQRLQRTPARALYGHSDESAMGHEWGHVARSVMEGLKSGDISSHLHPDSQPTTEGGAPAFGGVERTSRPLVEHEDVVSKYTPEQVVEDARKHVRANMAGAVVNELIHGIPIDANAGLHTDMAQSRQWLTDAGLTDAQAEVEIQNAINQVREDFQKHPQILDAIRENSQVRERGLDSTLHASKERVKNFENHIREIIDANENDGHDGQGNRGNEKEPNARVQGKNEKAGGEAASSEGEGKVKPGRAAVSGTAEAGPQGGHAGGGVASEEELARPGRFVKVSRSGAPTDQGKTPDFNLRPGEAGYQVTEEGPKHVAGEESAVTKRGAAAYHKEVFGRANLRGEKSGDNISVAEKKLRAEYGVEKAADVDGHDDDSKFVYPNGDVLKINGGPFGENDIAHADIESNQAARKIGMVRIISSPSGLNVELKSRPTEQQISTIARMAKNDGSLYFDFIGKPELSKKGSVGDFQRAVDKAFPENKRVNLRGTPPEKTTGSPETDEAIRAGGGVPGGKFGDLAMFHHPNGTTLALRPEGITPESVREHIGKKTEEYTQGDLRNTARSINPDFNPAPVQPDPRESEIADAYKAAKHEPNNPAVKASYDALKRDIDSQYDKLKGMGFKLETAKENPYGLSSEIPAHEELHRDVLRNKHLAVWEGGAPPADHPLSERDPKTGLTYNDKFRMVHDVFGHAAERTDFSPAGEESAWNLHRQLFSPEARPALATETRGQAAYTYKYGDFPPQKATILPEHLQVRPEDLGKRTELRGATQEAPLRGGEVLDRMRKGIGETEDASGVKGGASFITPEGTFIHLPGGGHHPDAIEFYGGPKAEGETRPEFMEESGAIRVRQSNGRAGQTLQVSVPAQGVNEAQADAIKRAVATMGRTGNMYLERGDVKPETKDQLTVHKEFVSPADVDGMLRKIDAYPDKNAVPNDSILGDQQKRTELRGAAVTPKEAEDMRAKAIELRSQAGRIRPGQKRISLVEEADRLNKEADEGEKIHLDKLMGRTEPEWHEKVAARVPNEPAGGVDPYTGESEKEGFGTELVPEARRPLDHPPTAQDFKDYRDQHEHLFQTHPELKVGWDTLGQRPELNVAATGPNAEEVARKLDQRSAYDIANRKEIPTGGKGEQTQFPDYPIEQRLADLKKEPAGRSELRGKESAEEASKKLGKGLSEDFEIIPRGQASPGAFENKRPFLLGDGSILANKEGYGAAGTEHRDIVDAVSSDALKNANAIRIRSQNNIEIFGKPTEAQMREISRMYKEGGAEGMLWDFSTPGKKYVAGSGAKTFKTGSGSLADFIRDVHETYPERLELRGKPKDSTEVHPIGSSVGLRTNPLPLKPSTETGVPSTVDVAMALNKFTKKQLPALQLGKAEPQEMIDRAKSLAEDEAKYQLAQNNTGAAWYTTQMADHDRILQGIRPELKDPAKLSIFKMAEAILSSGQKPYQNLKTNMRAWDQYQETGKFSPTNPDTGQSWGPRGIPAYGNAFQSLNRLIAEKGEQGASDWLLGDHTVKELKEYNDNVAGKADDVVPGAYILGPKRGPFAQNLHGKESAFTADMWVARTWNRWMGTAEVAPDGELYTDRPRSGRERELMKKSFSETADKLGMTTSSLQAVLWYYEQALYSAHGSAKESWSFSDAAQRIADDENSSFNFGHNRSELRGAEPQAAAPATQTYSVPAGWTPNGPTKAPGLLAPGNINLTTRPIVKNDDGTQSSEYSTSFQDDKGREVLVPTVVNGKFLTPDGKKPKPGSAEEEAMFQKAWQHYEQTGEHLGIYDNAAHANAAADQIHNRPRVPEKAKSGLDILAGKR